jgi:AcrR family transcriptional regulator
MDAAQRIFVRQGVAATRVDEIVAAAAVAKGTFYLHFESKEALLAALQLRFITDLSGELRAAMDRRRPGDWRGRLRAWVEAGVGGYRRHAALHDVAFHQFRPDDSGSRPAGPDHAIVDGLAEFLGRGTRAGAWSVQTPHLTAVLLFHALHGALDDATHNAAQRTRRKHLTRALQAFFERAVGLA